jgi:hypothetical protein
MFTTGVWIGEQRVGCQDQETKMVTKRTRNSFFVLRAERIPYLTTHSVAAGPFPHVCRVRQCAEFKVGTQTMHLARIDLYKNSSRSTAMLHLIDLEVAPYRSVLFLDAALLTEKCALGQLTPNSGIRAVLSCRSVIHPQSQ